MKLDKNKMWVKNRLTIPPTGQGILDGLKFTVKDVFNIKDQYTGFGNPLWEKTHPIAKENAICLQQLLANGASCIGKTIMSELGIGITGANYFYGMPYNPKAHELIPGGSSSGSAVSVANGSADFSLATDVGGSIRIPAAFCGLFGMRPSHGLISMSGVTSLVPSFDTVGVLSASINVLSDVMTVLLGSEFHDVELGDVIIIDDLLELCTEEVQFYVHKISNVFKTRFNKYPLKIRLSDIDEKANDPINGISNTFREVLCRETWTSISDWASEINLEFGSNTYVDLSLMKQLSTKNIGAAFINKEFYFKKLNDTLSSNNLFLIPTAFCTASQRTSAQTNDFNYAKLRPLISLSSLGKLPQINIPLFNQNKIPLGISLIAGFNKDAYLLKVVKELSKHLGGES